METLTAFDYKNQRWVTGEEARPHLIFQLRQEIEMCKSKDGLRYFRNISDDQQGNQRLPLQKRLKVYIAKLEEQLADL